MSHKQPIIIPYQPIDHQDSVVAHLKNNHIFELEAQNKNMLTQLLSSTNLTRKQNFTKESHGSTNVELSVAWTDIDSMDKFTDYIQHCMWIAVIGDHKTSDQLISGMIHVPANIIGRDFSPWQQMLLKVLKQYQRTLASVSHSYKVFYGGGAIWPDDMSEEGEQDSMIYEKGEYKLRYFLQSYLKTQAIKVTTSKGLGNELVYINTQEQQLVSFYPIDAQHPINPLDT